MKNITVSVDEETHRLARIRAAELDTSVSALVREFLRNLAEEPSPQDNPSESDVIHQHVDRAYEAAMRRAASLSGRPIRDRQELHREYVRSLRKVLADFDAQGVGVSDRLTREELYAEVLDSGHEAR